MCDNWICQLVRVALGILFAFVVCLGVFCFYVLLHREESQTLRKRPENKKKTRWKRYKMLSICIRQMDTSNPLKDDATSALEELSIFLLQIDQKFCTARISSHIGRKHFMKCWDHAYRRVLFLLLPQSHGYTAIAEKQIDETVAWLQQKRIQLIKRKF